MNVQAVRLALSEAMPTYFPGWAVTIDAWIELNASKTVQIGHAPPVPQTFRAQSIELPVMLWASEADEAEAVNDMYVAISFDTGTAVRQMVDDGLVTKMNVLAVGPREAGPTGYVAAEMTWHVQVANT